MHQTRFGSRPLIALAAQRAFMRGVVITGVEK